MDGGSTLRVPFPYFDGRGEGHCGQSSNLQIGQLIFFFFFFLTVVSEQLKRFHDFFFLLETKCLDADKYQTCKDEWIWPVIFFVMNYYAPSPSRLWEACVSSYK